MTKQEIIQEIENLEFFIKMENDNIESSNSYIKDFKSRIQALNDKLKVLNTPKPKPVDPKPTDPTLKNVYSFLPMEGIESNWENKSVNTYLTFDNNNELIEIFFESVNNSIDKSFEKGNIHLTHSAAYSNYEGVKAGERRIILGDSIDDFNVHTTASKRDLKGYAYYTSQVCFNSKGYLSRVNFKSINKPFYDHKLSRPGFIQVYHRGIKGKHNMEKYWVNLK